MSSGRPLFANLAWGIVVGMLVIHAASTAYYGHERMLARAQTFAVGAVDRGLVYRDLDARTGEIIASLGGDEFRTSLASEPRPIPERAWPHNEEVRVVVEAMLAARNVADRERFVYGFVQDGRAGHFLLSMPAADGRWLVIDAKTDTMRFGFGALWITILTGVILAIVLASTRKLTRYLPQFVEAAESIGRGAVSKALPENRGPREVRRASRAFNGMQQRVHALINERTQMLAAVSHDLRTIAARLHLRLEGLNDESERNKAERDLEAMSRILDESLTFARDESSEEARTLLDLRSLLQTVVDDVVDTGGDAQLIVETSAGTQGFRMHGQAMAIRRAIHNLVDNAVRYGGKASVTLKADGVVEIHDPGPGIAPEDMEQAMQPFVRLEHSRNRDTGGTGLGLAIAGNVVRRHRGTLTFSRSSAGFRVSVSLPSATA